MDVNVTITKLCDANAEIARTLVQLHEQLGKTNERLAYARANLEDVNALRAHIAKQQEEARAAVQVQQELLARIDELEADNAEMCRQLGIAEPPT